MKNSLIIDTTNQCNCDCMASVDDKTNTIFMIFKVGNVEHAGVQILVDDIVQQLCPLYGNGDNTIELPADYFATASNITVVYSDDFRSGDTLTFTFGENRTGDMILNKVDNFNYSVIFHKSNNTGGEGGGTTYTLPPADTENLGGVIVGNGLNVDKTGLLSVDESFFQSVSDGKELIASAITGRGVYTKSDATFKTMAENITKIPYGSGMAIEITYDYILIEPDVKDNHTDYIIVEKEVE